MTKSDQSRSESVEKCSVFKLLECLLAGVQTLLLLRNLWAKGKGKVCAFTPTFPFQR